MVWREKWRSNCARTIAAVSPCRGPKSSPSYSVLPKKACEAKLEKTLVLVVPPQKGLLEGFSTGLIALGNYVRLFDDNIRVQFLDLSLADLRDIADPISQCLLAGRGRVFVGITSTTGRPIKVCSELQKRLSHSIRHASLSAVGIT